MFYCDSHSVVRFVLSSSSDYYYSKITLVTCKFCETGSSEEWRGSSGEGVDDDVEDDDDAEGKFFYIYSYKRHFHQSQ